MNKLFSRPPITKVLRNELYARERLLIDTEAKADHAALLAQQHRLAADAQRASIARLRNELGQQ